MRRIVVEGQPSLQPLPDSVYRAMIPRATMMRKPDTAELMTSDSAQLFMGPGRALLAYPVHRGELYNIAITAVSSTPDEVSPNCGRVGKWNDPVSPSDLRKQMHDFCPLVLSLLRLIETCSKWTIAEVPPLKQWYSDSGRAVLLGDAAHAMSPHLAQGGAMAIEDAAVLAECIRSMASSDGDRDLKQSLRCYEAIRKSRVARIAEFARQNGASMLLCDGREQEERDRRFSVSLGDGSHVNDVQRKTTLGDQPLAWPSAQLVQWLYGFDAVRDAKQILAVQLR